MKLKRTLVGITAVLAAVVVVGSAFASGGVTPFPVAKNTDVVSTEALKDAQYVGSKTCEGCHAKEHADWTKTWHRDMHRDISPAIVVADFNNREITYKDIEIADSTGTKVKINPTVRVHRDGDRFLMTLIDKDDSANNQTYEIVYVLGGNWNQHFEARVSDRHYATPMRWEVADKEWFTKQFNDFWWVADGTSDGRPKKPSEMPLNQVGDAKCDACHTTGFITAKDTATGKWIAKRSELGISCEACHGPGSKHAQSGDKKNIVNPVNLNAVQQNQLCGRCHSRVTNKDQKDLAFPQGFIAGNTDLQDRVQFWTFASNPDYFWSNGDARKNRQQYQDIQKSKHQQAGVTCITCHDVHSTKKGYAHVRVSKNELCSSCHTASSEMFAGSTMAKVGTTCTDCHMAKLASRSGATKKAKEHWDVTAHTFKVVLPQAAAENKMKSSCDACHAGEVKDKKGAEIVQRQAEVKKRIDELKNAIAKYEKSGGKATESNNLLNTVLQDKSFGAHNYTKTILLLEKAEKGLIIK
jgi:predicted CXXCH cytochrome family protein